VKVKKAKTCAGQKIMGGGLKKFWKWLQPQSPPTLTPMNITKLNCNYDLYHNKKN